MTLIAMSVTCGLISPLMLAATPPPLTGDHCDRLSNQTSATDLRELLDDLGINPQENRIASDLTGLTWSGGLGAFFTATLRRDRVEQVVCQSAPASATVPGSADPHALCDQVNLEMSLTDVQATLRSPGAEIMGADGFPLNNIRQWIDPETQQVAIVAFNNFGEMSGLSCLNPPAIGSETENPSNAETNTARPADTF